MRYEPLMIWMIIGAVIILFTLFSKRAGPELREWYFDTRRKGYTHLATMVSLAFGLVICCAIWPFVILGAFKK